MSRSQQSKQQVPSPLAGEGQGEGKLRDVHPHPSPLPSSERERGWLSHQGRRSAGDSRAIRNRVSSRFPRPLRERDRVRGNCATFTLTPTLSHQGRGSVVALPSREREREWLSNQMRGSAGGSRAVRDRVSSRFPRPLSGEGQGEGKLRDAHPHPSPLPSRERERRWLASRSRERKHRDEPSLLVRARFAVRGNCSDHLPRPVPL